MNQCDIEKYDQSESVHSASLNYKSSDSNESPSSSVHHRLHHRHPGCHLPGCHQLALVQVGASGEQVACGTGFESCAAVLNAWTTFFTLHCSSSLSCINEYLAIDSGGYVYETLSRINCSIRLDTSRRS